MLGTWNFCMDHRMIVGLGNPGQKYKSTRHNIGFLVVQELMKRWGTQSATESGVNADIAKATVDGVSVWLVRPKTYMNHSGSAVQAAAGRVGIDVSQELLIVGDDLNLKFGHLRLKPGGRDGGHNGLKSIQEHLQTQNYPRLRMGIGRPAPGEDPADFVLGEFLATERDGLTDVLAQACDCCEIWVRQGMAKAMECHNTSTPTKKFLPVDSSKIEEINMQKQKSRGTRKEKEDDGKK